MSLRLLTTRIVRHGRTFLQSYWKRDIHFNIYEPNTARTRFRFPATSAAGVRYSVPNAAKNAINAVTSTTGSQSAYSLPRWGIFRFGQHARKLFVDNILNRVTTNYSQQLRTEATKRLFYGDSAPFFALIGVSLVSGTGVLTKEDELEGVCWEIREAANRLQNTWNNDEVSETLKSDFNIDNLDIGPPIAKGCAAVVYAASFRSEQSESTASVDTSHEAELAAAVPSTAHLPVKTQYFHPELMSPIQQMSRFVHNFGGSVDNLHVFNQTSTATAFGSALSAFEPEKHKTKKQEGMKTINGADIDSVGLSTSNAQGMQSLDVANVSIDRYPFALKMMFNYDIQSNALSILRAMYKETVPARQRFLNNSSEWESLVNDQTVTLPPHPNIVCMFGFFCDEVRNFPDGHILYPIAQPQRINPLGYGRNMSLYLLMKRYDYSLRGLLDINELTARTKVLLLAQLLEAVAHINRFGIAHRDIKSDNVLIELNDDNSAPVLVLSDFGCCLADKVHGLQLPYTSFDIDKGGNAALMAPEIINKKPGSFAVLNYAKADLWACGAIAYEIFGLPNPFYSSTGGLAADNGETTYSLRNCDYKHHDLPPLSGECPLIVQQLIFNILHPNPSKRLSTDLAANVIQLYLWAPSQWLKPGGIPHSPEILQWLLSLTTKLMCEGRPKDATVDQLLRYNQSGRRTYVEYLLICSFLARAQLKRVRGALNWIQSVL